MSAVAAPRLRRPEPEHRRTEQKVRRGSRQAGSFETHLWRPFKAKDVGAWITAAEKYELAHKEKGKRVGPLGQNGVRVFREMLRLIDYRTGRLDPSWSTLQARLELSRSAIDRALKMLRAHGFLDWVRRFVETGERGRRGQQVAQTSSAYVVSLPARAARLVSRLLKMPAGGEDDLCRRQSVEAEVKAQLAGMAPEARASAEFDNPRLAAAIARLDRAIQGKSAQREQSGQSQE